MYLQNIKQSPSLVLHRPAPQLQHAPMLNQQAPHLCLTTVPHQLTLHLHHTPVAQ